MKEALKFSGIEQNKNHEKTFKTKEDLVIFEIKNNINPIIIKRGLKELKQLEKELEDLKQQEEEQRYFRKKTIRNREKKNILKILKMSFQI